MNTVNVRWFENLRMQDVGQVGGKNASLGEMISQLAGLGVKVPGGFATTADAYREFLTQDGLDSRIRARLDGLDVGDVAALAAAGLEVRAWILATPLQPALAADLRAAHAALLQREGAGITLAVRSSATAEDLPDASFAGQQETFLNVDGEAALLQAVREVFASLYNDRAIAYRVHQGYAHADIALSAGVQRMVRSDLGASGVMFTLDTESGFDQVVFITAAYGLGETVVQGAVNPDEYYVYKPALRAGKTAVIRRTLGGKAIRMVYATPAEAGRPVRTERVEVEAQKRFAISDAEAEELAHHALVIEQHYGRGMDIEWGRDGLDGRLYILQARPETVQNRSRAEGLQRYVLRGRAECLVSGRAIGRRIGAGPVCLVADAKEMWRVRPGDVLVTDMTDPDWEPVMKRAAAIVTDRGGRTCHAAIVARELGIPAVVGCKDATARLAAGREVTVSCAEGDIGNVYAGRLDFERQDIMPEALPELPVKLAMNIANPELAFEFSRLPGHGVGLARLEFIIARMIGIHPRAALAYPDLAPGLKAQVEERCAGYADPVTFYVDKMAEGIATLAAAFAPKPVILRFSDFKSNEYSTLLGGAAYEPHEENPMIGFRGASRYAAGDFRAAFALECRAVRKVREEMGLENLEVMIPFVRTPDEARGVLAEMASHGLERGRAGLRVIMMCEIPTNALQADDFLDLFDGFSIGSNDLTQLTLGIDRDSGIVAGSFDERDPAVLKLITMAIEACRRRGKYIGICGQGPSDHPDFARWLLEQGVGTISLNPDTVVETWLSLGQNTE